MIARRALEGGGVLLGFERSGRPRGGGGALPARVITMVWGERYLDDLLSVTLPALMAPGNLPAFADRFASEVVIVTERRFFATIAQAPVVARLLEHCDMRLLPVDDLLSPWYGITLTYALVRGFADLGAAMVETNLVFLNADFVIADGSLRVLADVIESGRRLAVAPSYCMVLEETLGALRALRDPDACSLAVSKRDLAGMILAHRHNTIRAKTVNQRLFRMHRYDQFYWYVDETTLLGRQMPISVVFMRPERVVTELPTFWDYGVISECCPDAVPAVLGDSDEFLMAELRSGGTFRELLNLGWPDVEEIAADLSSFTTHDHRVYGRFPLRLHSRDLPPQTEAEEKNLAAFVDDVYRRLTPPISHRDHPFWAGCIPRFKAMMADRKHIPAIADDEGDRSPDLDAEARDTGKRVVDAGAVGRLARLYERLFGRLPHTTRLHPLHPTLRPLMAALSEAAPEGDVLFVTSGGALGTTLMRGVGRRRLVVTPAMVKANLYESLIGGTGGFALCVCDLGAEDLLDARALLDSIRPLMAAEGRFVLFHYNAAGQNLDALTYSMTERMFPLFGRSRVSFAGSAASRFTARRFLDQVGRRDVSGAAGMAALGATMALCAPLAWAAGAIEARRDPHLYPRNCTSMTIEIALD